MYVLIRYHLDDKWAYPLFSEILSFFYQLLHVWVLRTGFGLGCATSWSLLMLFLFKAVPVLGDKILLPQYESTDTVIG